MSRYNVGDKVRMIGRHGKPTPPVWTVTWVYSHRNQVDLVSGSGGSRVAVHMDHVTPLEDLRQSAPADDQ